VRGLLRQPTSHPMKYVAALDLLRALYPAVLDPAKRDLAAALGSANATGRGMAAAFLSAKLGDDAIDVLGRAAGPDSGHCPQWWLDEVVELTAVAEHRPAAARLLHRMATGAAGIDSRTEAATRLVALGGDPGDQGITDLVTIASSQSDPPNQRLDAARALSRLGPQHRAVVAATFQAAIALANSSARLELSVELARVDPQSRALALTTAEVLATDRQLDLPIRAQAIKALADLRPAQRDGALQMISRLILDQTYDLDRRLELAGQCSMWTRDFRNATATAAADLIEQLAEAASIEQLVRLIQLAQLDAAGQSRALMRFVANAADIVSSARAARQLAILVPAQRQEAAGVLANLATRASEPSLAICLLYEAAKAGSTRLAVDGLAALARDASLPAEVRDAAARLMLMLDPLSSDAARAILDSLVADPTLVGGPSSWLLEARDWLAMRSLDRDTDTPTVVIADSGLIGAPAASWQNNRVGGELDEMAKEAPAGRSLAVLRPRQPAAKGEADRKRLPTWDDVLFGNGSPREPS
jgi:hypothetical protein